MAWLTIFSAAYGLECSTAAYGGLGRRLRGLNQGQDSTTDGYDNPIPRPTISGHAAESADAGENSAVTAGPSLPRPLEIAVTAGPSLPSPLCTTVHHQ